RESLRHFREGEFVRNLPHGFQWFGAGQSRGQWLVVLIALAIFALFAWASRNLAAGRAVYATGSDPEAARLAGIRPRRVVLGVFACIGTHFFSLDNAFEVLRLSVEIGLLAIALTPVIVSGGIDLSVGSLMGLSAVLFGAMWRDLHLPIGVAAALTLIVGAVAG